VRLKTKIFHFMKNVLVGNQLSDLNIQGGNIIKLVNTRTGVSIFSLLKHILIKIFHIKPLLHFNGNTLLWALQAILLPSIAFSAPAITSVTGTLTNGQSITISGSGFGTKTAAPLISSYDNATSANNFHSGSIGGGWSTPQGSVSLTTNTPRTALYQSDYKATYNPNAGEYQTIGYDRGTADAVTYSSFWHYRDYSACHISTGGGDNNKLYRIYASGSGSMPTPYFGVRTNGTGTCDVTYIGGDNLLSHTYTAAYDPLSGYKNSGAGLLDYDIGESWPLQQWVHFEVLVQWGTTNAGDGIVTIWRNGQTIMRLTGVGLVATGAPNDSRLTRWGLVSGGMSAAGNEYLDQLYFDNTQARVFVSNSANLAASWPDIATTNHKEIQVPSAWSASEITLTLNTGTFTNHTTDGRYLYVVDSSGAISNAYDLAGDPPADETAPAVTADDSTKSIGSDSYSAEGDATDAVGVSGCKWRIGSAPDSGNGTGCTGTTAWTCSTSGYSSGEQTLYIGCYDAAGNYGTDTVVVTYTPTSTVTSMTGGLISGGTFYR
jgi:hypothetical protein